MCGECGYTVCLAACANAPVPKPPRCPDCGAETDTFLKGKHGIVGCPACFESVDAWEEQDE